MYGLPAVISASSPTSLTFPFPANAVAARLGLSIPPYPATAPISFRSLALHRAVLVARHHETAYQSLSVRTKPQIMSVETAQPDDIKLGAPTAKAFGNKAALKLTPRGFPIPQTNPDRIVSVVQYRLALK